MCASERTLPARTISSCAKYSAKVVSCGVVNRCAANHHASLAFSRDIEVAKRITLLPARGARVLAILGTSLLALCMNFQPSLAQKEVLSGRGPVALTPAQQ